MSSTIALLVDSTLAAGIVSWTLRGSIVLTAAWLVARWLRGSPAATRHLVWASALIVFVLLPVVGSVAPPLEVDAPALSSPLTTTLAAAPRVAASGGTTPAVVPRTSDLGAGGPPTGAAPELVKATPEPTIERSTETPTPTTRSRYVSYLAAVWLAGVVLCGVRAAIARSRRRRLARNAVRLTDTGWELSLREAQAALGLRRSIRLLRSSLPVVPMTWGTVRPTVLLPRDADVWSGHERRAVLLHELAHVRRHDAATHALGRALLALHWFNPLVWLATRATRAESERACDDLVVTAGERPSRYARHLLEIARRLGVKSSTPVGALAMAGRSHLGRRIEAILDHETPRRSPGWARRFAVTSVAAGVAWLLGAGTLLPAATIESFHSGGSAVPGVSDTARVASSSDFRNALDSGACGQKGRHGTRTEIDGDQWRIEVFRALCSLRLELDGDVRFDDDETGIEWLAPRSRFEIEETIPGQPDRWMEARAGRDGEIAYRYEVDRRDRPWDDDARAWLASLLPELFRATGLDAERRVERFWERGGFDAVTDEMALITSDHVVRRYASILLGYDLGVDQVDRLLALAGDRIDSDFELAELLISAPVEMLGDERIRRTYLEAAATIDSDFELRRTLQRLIETQDLDAEIRDAVIELGPSIESDFELAELMIAAIREAPDHELPDAFFVAAEAIASDFELGRVLKAALGTPLTTESTRRCLELAESIGSDFELAEVLVATAREGRLDDAGRSAYRHAAATIGSDYERRRALDAIGGI